MSTMLPNEKKDVFWTLLFFLLEMLVVLILMFTFSWNAVSLFIFPFALLNLPRVWNNQKRMKKISHLKQVLGLSDEAIRKIIHAGKYDMIKWEKGKLFLSQKQLYQLEYYLEKQYEKI